jgi:hypothetical protein
MFVVHRNVRVERKTVKTLGVDQKMGSAVDDFTVFPGNSGRNGRTVVIVLVTTGVGACLYQRSTQIDAQLN